MVPAGAFVTVHVSGTARMVYPRDVQKLVTETVPFPVRAFTIDSPDLVASVLSGLLLSYTYAAVLTVQTVVDHTDVNDIGAIVAHAFADATGATPSIVWASTTDAPPSGDEPAAGGYLDNIKGFFAGIGSGVSSVVSGVQADVQLALWAILAIVVVLIIAVFWGPNTGHVARAAGALA